MLKPLYKYLGQKAVFPLLAVNLLDWLPHSQRSKRVESCEEVQSVVPNLAFLSPPWPVNYQLII